MNYADLLKQPVMGGNFNLDNLDTATPTDLFGGKMTIPKDPGMSLPDWNTATPGSVFGTGLPADISNPIGTTNANWGADLSSLLNSFSSGGSSAAPAAGSSGGGLSSWLSNFLSGNPADGGAAGLAPYLAAGAGGIAMAKDAQNQATKEADKLAALGQPYTDAGKQLLSQYQSGTLRPDQQKVVDTSAQFSSDLLNAASPLGQIAQQAFADYNSGKLGATDELKLNNQVASQKQQIRQRLQSSGITDSSVLAAQDQQIDNQAMIARQDLLDKRFATGNTAYDQWLKTTNEGQQLKLQGQQFAATSFEQMLNNSLGLASEGMQPAMQAIQLKIQSDAELSQTVSELLGNLASAYSYARAQPQTQVNVGTGGAGGGTQQAGGAPSGLSQIISGISGIGGLVKDIGGLFGFKGAGGQAAGLSGILGKAAAPLSVLGAIKGWEPGDVKGDTLRGLQAGASVGSVVPVVGTAVGAVVGAALGALSSLIGHKESDSHKVWEKYKTSIPAGTPGSQIPPDIFEEAMLGAWQSNQKALDSFTKMNGGSKHGGNAEGFKGWMVNQLAQAVTSGTVKQGMTSDQVFSSVIAPAMDKYWKDTGSKMNMATWQQKWPDMVKIVSQLTDRALSGQQIDRHSEDYKGEGSKYKDVPSLQEAVSAIMGKKTIQPVMGAPA